MLIVTHNNSIKDMVHKVVYIKDGLIKKIISTKQECLRLNWRIYDMNKILSKRILRDLKENLFRYIALGLLIALGMYIIVSIVGAAETIIVGTERKAEENLLEDGEFGVFVPLTREQTDKLENSGITIEMKFSFDVEGSNSRVLRIMKNRSKINLINLDCGRLAEMMVKLFLKTLLSG